MIEPIGGGIPGSILGSMVGTGADVSYVPLLIRGTPAGQNGPFRTPRHIIRLMVEMVEPKPTDICLRSGLRKLRLWGYTGEKRGAGGISGAVAIPPQD
jgi:hypothetical protein